MTVFSALLLAGFLSVLALGVGITAGARLAPRVAERQQRAAAEWAGITVAEMLQRIVALTPLGTAVVDTHRDVVYRNDRATELGLVRDRKLDDQAWQAAQQALVSGDDGRKMLVLGLSKINIQRLQAGKPIVVDDLIEQIDMEILIFTGDTEQSMARDMEEFVGPKTQVRIDPRLKE